MRNIKLTIRYDGTRYAGWQSQRNAKTVQETIERAIKALTREKVNLIGSGRTDSGVHAMGQVANFKTRSKLPLKNIEMGLNSILPEDILVCGAEEVDLKFNAQTYAKDKIYRYTISNTDFVDPFLRAFAARCFYRLNTREMKRATAFLLGSHDFRSFRTEGGRKDNTVRTIKRIKIEKDGDMIYIDIEANGFLYNMARSVVGTLIEVGRGKIKADSVKEILAMKDRKFCGPTAPAKGLCLMKVRYPPSPLRPSNPGRALAR